MVCLPGVNMSAWRGWWMAGLVVGSAGVAHAGATDAGPGTGFKISPKGRIHLSLGASTGVDTNPNIVPYALVLARTGNSFSTSSETIKLASVGPQVDVPYYFPNPNKLLFSFPPDVFVAVRPGAAISQPGEKLDLRADIGINYYEYLGILNPGLPFMPGTIAYSQAQANGAPRNAFDLIEQYNQGYRRLRTIDGRMGGAMALNKKGLWGLVMDASAQRSIDPGPLVVGSRLARTNFGSGVQGVLRPGGGTMEFSGRLGVRAEIYDPQNGKDFLGNALPPFSAWDRFPANLLGKDNPADLLGVLPYANATVDPSQFHTAGGSVGGRWQWRFLPKSAVFVEGNVGLTTYLKFWDNPNGIQVPMSVLGGFMGQVTAKLGVVASLGLSYPLVLCFDPGPNFTFDRFNQNARCAANTGYLNGQTGQSDLDILFPFLGGIQKYMWWAPDLLRIQPILNMPVGQIEARYQFTPTVVGAVGFRRAVKTVPLYRYQSDNRFYTSISANLFKRLALSANLSNAFQPHGQLTDRTVAYNAFPQDTAVRENVSFLRDADPGRFDNDIQLAGSADLNVTPWLVFGVSNSLNWHLTNAWTGAPDATPGIYNEKPFNLSYARNLTVFKVELRY
jgi:hypothetical protein